jgi:pyruvate dehydrogenase E2 component (dihydrolipoyllysine-residue acetyltransferase)
VSEPIAALTMPKWGLVMSEGKIVAWKKREGESVAAGEEILEIETTKITNVVEMPHPGTLRRIVAPEGATLPVGALLAVIAPESAPEGEIDAFIAGFKTPEIAAEGVAAEEAAPRAIEAGGRRLSYFELGQGAGTPLLLLHGFGADLNSWMFVQPALAEGRRAIALDLPGHGGSSKEVGAGDAAALAEAAESALDALGVESVHLVGHSLGGAVAVLLARRRPDKVKTLSLIAAVGLGPEINSAFIDGFIRASRRREAQEVLSLLVADPSLISRRMVEDVLRYKRLDGVGAALERIAEAAFGGGRQQLDLKGEIAALRIPVQILWGREDRIIPPSHAEALRGLRPVHILEGAGHLPHMEKAPEVAGLLKAFLTP